MGPAVSDPWGDGPQALDRSGEEVDGAFGTTTALLARVESMLGEAFRRDGFCVLPMLDPDEVAKLRATCDRLHPCSDHGFVSDFESVDSSFKRRTFEASSWVWDHLPAAMDGHRPFLASFLLKWPTPDSQLDLHADWSYVDERRWHTIAAWIPLVDTGPSIDNGALLVVPGSHRLVHSWRGTNTPPWYESGERGFLAAARPVEVPAGSVVLFDNRLLHYSPPNRSDHLRPVLAAALAPKDAPLLHVVGDGRSSGTLITVDANFFLDQCPSSLRSNPPATHLGEQVELVTESLDPWALAADHGVVDASAFRGIDGGPSDRRWPDPAPDPTLVIAADSVREHIGWIDARCAPLGGALHEGASALREVVLAEGCRLAPSISVLGLDRSIDSRLWRSMRVLRIPPLFSGEVLWPPEAGSRVHDVGRTPQELPVVLCGATGWTSVAANVTSAVEPGRVRISNRNEGPTYLLVGEPLTGSASSRRLRAISARLSSRRDRYRRAVEAAIAVAP